MTAFRHLPAMPAEVLCYLDCRPGDIVADGTLGGSGHAGDICRRLQPHGVFIGIDQDPDAIRHARQVLRPENVTVHIFHANYIQLPQVLSHLKIPTLDGILLDLGMSQHHLDGSGRGFSFLRNEPLDMRMDPTTGTTAAELIARLRQDRLEALFKNYGEERYSKRIARQIAIQRKRSPIKTTGRLVEIILKAVPGGGADRRRHPATKVFMALRIAVNNELERLSEFLGFAPDLLNPGGRLCVLSFHSLEDRLVKKRFKSLEGRCTCPPGLPACGCGASPVVRVLTPKVVRPTQQEIAANPLSRSTRLRACEKLSPGS